MILKSLTMRRCESWETMEGFVGELETVSPNGKVAIKLSDEACRRILEVASQGIREAAAETAQFLSTEAQETLTLEGSKS